MSVHTADSHFSFKLPTMSYIDAKWEEPNLRSPAATERDARKGGLAAWMSRGLTAFAMWRLNREAATDLQLMSDRELMDIGLNRADVGRVFDPAFNQDLLQRGR